MEPLVFRQWSNKKYAVLCTFHRVIRIATLSLSCMLVIGRPAAAQADTTAPRLFYDLEEVEATGEQEAALYSPYLRQVLIIQQDQLLPAPSRSLADLLDDYPGIDIRTRGVRGIQSDLSIQGGSFDQSQVLLNGMEITDPQTGHFSMDIPLDLSAVKRIELLKGPSSKRYGPGAYSGALNLVTRPADTLHVSAGITYGSYNTYSGDATMQLPVGKSKNMLSVSSSGTDGYTSNTDATSHVAWFQSAMQAGPLKSDLFLGWNSRKFGALAFYTPLYPDQYEETRGIFAGLKIRQARKKNGLSGSIHWRRHFDHFLLFRDNPSAYENLHRTDLLSVSLGRSFRSQLGVTNLHTRFVHDRILSTTLGDPQAELIPVRKSDRFYDHAGSRNRFSLSADHQVQWNRLYLSAGVLLQAGIRDMLEPGIYPGIDIAYEISPGTDLFVSLNRSMRLPTYTDLYYDGPQNMGNAELKPEKAVTAESGISMEGRWYRINLSLFYRKGTETIDWIWRDSIWQTSNLTELDTYGGETTILFKPVVRLFNKKIVDHARISYAYTGLSKSSDTYISNYALDNLKHKAVAGIRLRMPRKIYLELNTSWQDRNGYYLYYRDPSATPYEKAYDPFWLIDINAGISLEKITLFVNITNLTNTAYRDIGSVPMPGRWVMAGISIR